MQLHEPPVIIDVVIPSTASKRNPGQRRTDATYTVTKNGHGVGSRGDPLVVVRGSRPLRLSATVSRSQPIWWSVTPVNPTGLGPVLPQLSHREGNLNYLSTDAVGLFVVSAGFVRVGPPTLHEPELERTTLYVHFVSASVAFDQIQDDNTTEVTLAACGAITVLGSFEFRATANVNCGGPNLDAIANKVKIKVIQNVRMGEPVYFLGALYRREKPGTRSQSNPRAAPRMVIGSRSAQASSAQPVQQQSPSMVPAVQYEEGWLLEAVPPAQSPYVDCSDESHVPFYKVSSNNKATVRIIEFSDAPGLTTPPCYIRQDPNSIWDAKDVQELVRSRDGYMLRQVKGTIWFRAAVVAVSEHCPNIYLVLGWIDWTLSMDRDIAVEFDKGSTTWGMKLVCGVDRMKSVTRLDPQILPRPIDALEAGLETFGPIATGEEEDDADYSKYTWKGPG